MGTENVAADSENILEVQEERLTENTEKPDREESTEKNVETITKECVGGTDCIDDCGMGTTRNVGNLSANMNMEQDTITPSVGMNVQKMKCEPDRAGLCGIHECVGKWIQVSSKKWKDCGKGRGFGYVNGKNKKFICGNRVSLDNTDMDPSGRFRDNTPVRISDVSRTSSAGIKGKVCDGITPERLPGKD